MVRPVFVYRRFKREKCGSARWLLVLVLICMICFGASEGAGNARCVRIYITVARVWLFEI